MDPGRKGVIKAKDLWHILVKWGEKLSPREGNLIEINFEFSIQIILIHLTRLPHIISSYFSVDQIFREANISPNGVVRYEQFVKIVSAPVPDYY